MTTIAEGLKRTPVGPVPEDWAVATIGDIATTSSGTTPSRALFDRYYANGTINWAKTLDLHGVEIEDTDEKVTPVALEETSLRLYPAGTVLVAMYGGFNQIGRTGLLRKPAAVNQAISAIQVSPTKLLPDYLLAVLNLSVRHWKSVASSSRKDPNITSADVRGFPIAIPPLKEQQAIAVALRDLAAFTRSLGNLVAKKRDLKQAMTRQLLACKLRLPGFTAEWQTRRLGELLMYEQPTKYLVSSDEYSDTHDVPVLTAGKTFVLGYTNETKGIVTDLPVIIFDDFTTASKYVNFPFKAKSSAMKLLRLRDPSCNLKVLYEMIQLVDFKLGDHKRYWISEFQHLNVKLPGAEEQTAIAAVLNGMDSEMAMLEVLLAKALALKQAMMQQLLTGRIRLR